MAKSNCCVYLIPLFSILVAEFGGGAAAALLGGKTLKIGVPMTSDAFVDVKLNSTNQTVQNQVTGYSIDVFHATVSYLEGIGFNVSYEFEAFANREGISAGSYDDLLHQIPEKKYDGVVGDVTIVANRSTFVDFTLPYTDSGVRMLTQVRHSRHLDMWIFMRPFSWDLWLSIVLFCVFTGFSLLFMERNANKEAGIEDSLGRKRLTRPSILCLPLAQAVLPERESVAKKCSSFVLLVWLGLAFVLMQSYTASLSSILTVDQIKPTYPTVDNLKRDQEFVGYRDGSFVGNFLKNQLQFDKSRLKPYPTDEEYRDALNKGSHKGGVAAVFDELPFIKSFIKRHGSKYMMAGPTYRTDGFGFAFPRGSNLTYYFSRAILNVTEGPRMDEIEQKYFGINDDDLQDQYDQISAETPSLSAQSFAGLFIITGSLILFAMLVSESRIWQRPVMAANTFSKRFLSFSSSKKVNPSEDGSTNGRDAGSTNEGNNHPESVQRSSLPV